MPEGLATLVTLVALLAGVAGLVCHQGCVHCKVHLADGALVGPLPSVHAPLFTEGEVVAEGLATLAALTWLLAAVASLVHHKGPACGKVHLADRALVGLLPGVHALVHSERGAVAKGLATLAALVELLPSVHMLVRLE